MNRPDLQQFAQQLVLWTELIIENGRTPFRRVELYPELHTNQGTLQPPLIFWINRQSMMAGGILLLPEDNLEQELKRGRSCCDALGLKHFVTWETEQVRIWQLNGEEIEQHQQFELKNADHPDSFRHLLGDLLEALKLLAVIGHVANDQLSPHYLHNLFQTTLDHALPALINSYRRQRAEEDINPLIDADQLATEANRLILLQLLGLAWHQQLPTAILPEKLERAIQLSLPQLPVELQEALTLQATENPPELPLETAVCFQHLLLRLRQLSWREPEQRAIDSMKLLIEQWSSGQAQQPTAEILLYPEGSIPPEQTQQLLSDSPSLLAAASLHSELQQRPRIKLQAGNLFQLDFGTTTDLKISGRLLNPRHLSRDERQRYMTLLRTSWPNRRFRISADKPLWFWELIHLFGISKKQRKLSLVLPQTLLKNPATDIFWELLMENYRIDKLTSLSEQRLNLELCPGAEPEHKIQVILDDETRLVQESFTPSRLRSQLLLALKLPAEIYQLLSEKLVWPDAESDTKLSPGLQHYFKSDLCRLFCKTLGIDLQTTGETTKQQLAELPRPDSLTLMELASAMQDETEQPEKRDGILSSLLQSPALRGIEDYTQHAPDHKTDPSQQPTKALRNELVVQLQTAGIPTFPEQYMYFLDQPETVSYQWTSPLNVKNELLGEIELEDAAGQRLTVYGEELANALLLCSDLEKSVAELPKDRNQLALLQQHYWNDLAQLHKQLNSLCHSRLKSPKEANKLAKKVWKTLKLPKLP